MLLSNMSVTKCVLETVRCQPNKIPMQETDCMLHILSCQSKEPAAELMVTVFHLNQVMLFQLLCVLEWFIDTVALKELSYS